MQRIAAARRQPGDKHPALHYKAFIPHQRVSKTQAVIHRLFYAQRLTAPLAGDKANEGEND